MFTIKLPSSHLSHLKIYNPGPFTLIIILAANQYLHYFARMSLHLIQPKYIVPVCWRIGHCLRQTDGLMGNIVSIVITSVLVVLNVAFLSNFLITRFPERPASRTPSL